MLFGLVWAAWAWIGVGLLVVGLETAAVVSAVRTYRKGRY